MDGEIDYSKYSTADLNEALSRIDKQRYPQNHANLLKEAANRPPAEPKQASGGRPALVKVILALYSIGIVVMGFFTIVVLVTWPAGKQALQTLSAGFLIEIGIGLVITIATTVQLFRMKRSAFYLSAAGVAVSTLGSLVYLASGIPLSLVLSPSSAFGYVFNAWVCYYTWLLKQRNVLN